MATLTITEIVPIDRDEDGVMRVSKTRVSLDSLVAAFKDGATPEEIAQQYPSVLLADVYSIIGYYLRHPESVDAYLFQRLEQAGGIKGENDSRFPSIGVRERLLARRANRAA